jgi:hypothetical protein
VYLVVNKILEIVEVFLEYFTIVLKDVYVDYAFESEEIDERLEVLYA